MVHGLLSPNQFFKTFNIGQNILKKYIYIFKSLGILTHLMVKFFPSKDPRHVSQIYMTRVLPFDFEAHRCHQPLLPHCFHSLAHRVGGSVSHIVS